MVSHLVRTGHHRSSRATSRVRNLVRLGRREPMDGFHRNPNLGVAGFPSRRLSRPRAVREGQSPQRRRSFALTTPVTFSSVTGQPPGTPTNLAASLNTYGDVHLTWTAPTSAGGDGATIAGYRIMRNRSEYDHYDILVTDTETADTSYTDTTVIESSTYNYRVYAIDNSGQLSLTWSEPAQVTTPEPTPPQKPTNLAASLSGGVTLTWTAPTNAGNNGATIAGYRIDRQVAGAGNPYITIVPRTITATTTYIDATAAGATTYNYRVHAVNDFAKHSTSSNTTQITLPADQPPGTPTNLTSTATTGQITLAWTAPTNAGNNGATIAGYKIVRRIVKPGTVLTPIVENTQTSVTTYTDTDIQANTTYAYRIYAINSRGLQGGRSHHTTLTTPP